MSLNPSLNDRKRGWFSYGLVCGQFTLIVGLALTGSLIPESWSLRGILIVGGLVGIWALHTMGIHHLRIFPEVSEQGRLVVNGPYRWVRHPMYTSVLSVTFSWMMIDPVWFRIGLWVILFGVLWIKLEYEEKLLTKQFPSYSSYQRQTYRLIPFVF